MGTVDVVVVEEFPEEGYNKVTTIEHHTKNVRVQSLGSKKTYVRVRLVPHGVIQVTCIKCPVNICRRHGKILV